MLRAHGGMVSMAARIVLAGLVMGGVVLYGVGPGPARTATAAETAAGRPAVSLDCGYSHTLLVTSSGALWAWGDNSRGQMGLDDRATRLSPVQVGADTNWKSVSAGWFFSLAVRTDGTLWAWGDNRDGQLGIGSRDSKLVPTRIGTDADWTAVAAGQSHSLGLRSDGTLWAWGDNSDNRMGTAGGTVPSRVGTAASWVSIAVGDAHSLGVRADGTLWSWGHNETCELGLGHANLRTGLNRVGSGTDWVSVAAEFRHSMAIRRDGTLWAWGWNVQGQLGLGDVDNRAVPTQVGEASWAGVFPGRVHCLGIQSNGSLWSWATNYDGELGLGDLMERLAPVRVGNAAWAAASCGDAFSTGVRAEGAVWAWGRNASGQLGTGDTVRYTRPQGCDMPAMDWPPAVNTVAASHVLGTMATLNSHLYSLGSGSTPAQVSFEWGEGTSYGETTPARTMTGTGACSAGITGLEPETWYHFRARAEGANGASYGSDMSFRTTGASPAPPEVKTIEASRITGSTARLHGRVADMGTASSITVSFEYGTAEGAYDHRTDNDTVSKAGAFYADINGLAAGTTYFFRARGSGDGDDQGGAYSFVTAGAPVYPPMVETAGADRLTTRSARLHGTLTQMGTAINVTVLFEWGEAPGSYTADSGAAGQAATGGFHCDINGLLPGRTYYYRAQAVGDGTVYGAEQHFSVPAMIPEPASISPSGAVPGRMADVTVTGRDFTNCIALDLGPGITIEAFTVISESEITARITLAPDTATGPRNVTVNTASGSYVLEGGFVVKGESSGGIPLWAWGATATLGALVCGAVLFVLLRPRRMPAR